jgi:hypothetical protein
MKVNVKDGFLDGQNYGWHTVSVFEMSTADYVWSDFNLDNKDLSTSWTEYKIPFGAGGLDFSKADPKTGKVGSQSNVMAIGINVYGTMLTGTIVIDEVRLYKADGTYDVLETFNKTLPSLEGIATGSKVDTDEGAANAKTVTPKTSAILGIPAIAKGLHLSVEHGVINASFNAATAGRTTISLMNSLGQVITSKNVNATRGANSVSLETSYQGTAFLVIRQGSQKMVKSVRLK